MTRAQALLLAVAVAIGAFGAGLLLSADDRLDPPEPIVVEGPQGPGPTTGAPDPTAPEIVLPPTVTATDPPPPPTPPPGDDDDDDGGDDGGGDD